MWIPRLACRHRAMGDTKREDRLCQVCHSSGNVEKDHNFLIECPACGGVRKRYDSIFQQASFVSTSFVHSEPFTHVMSFSQSVVHVGRLSHPPHTFYNLH